MNVLVTGGTGYLGGAVTIFRHDWPFDSSAATRDLDHRVTPFADGIAATVASIRQTV